MKLYAKIYKEKEIVNDFTMTKDADIYKELALIFYEKIAKRPTKASFKYDKATRTLKAYLFYDKEKTQSGVAYSYCYTIEKICL